MFVRIMVVVATMCMYGCAVDKYTPTDDKVTLQVIINPVMFSKNQLAKIVIEETPSGRYCTLYLKEYPICLKHGVRHCLEGNWHTVQDADKDCF